MKKFTLAMAMVAMMVVCAIGFSGTGIVTAQSKADICTGIGMASGSTDCSGGETEVNKVVAAVINILSVVVGVVAVIMIIIGGFKYITSAGDSSKVSSAKSTIMYALIGLVIVALAQFIVRFVLNRAVPDDPAQQSFHNEIFRVV